MTVYVEDVFDDTNNTELDAHTASPTGGDWHIQTYSVTPTGNILRIKTNDTVKTEKVISCAHFVDVDGGTTVPRANYVVEVEGKIGPSAAQLTESIGVLARGADESGDNITGYAAALFSTPTNYKFGILKWDDAGPSSPTILVSKNVTYTNNTLRTIRLVVAGPSIHAYLTDGEQGTFTHDLQLSAQDTSITAAGRAGLFFELDQITGGQQHRFRGNSGQNFKVYDLPVSHILRGERLRQTALLTADLMSKRRHSQLQGAWR